MSSGNHYRLRTTSVQELIDQAGIEAKKYGSRSIFPEHLFLALCRVNKHWNFTEIFRNESTVPSWVISLVRSLLQNRLDEFDVIVELSERSRFVLDEKVPEEASDTELGIPCVNHVFIALLRELKEDNSLLYDALGKKFGITVESARMRLFATIEI